MNKFKNKQTKFYMIFRFIFVLSIIMFVSHNNTIKIKGLNTLFHSFNSMILVQTFLFFIILKYSNKIISYFNKSIINIILSTIFSFFIISGRNLYYFDKITQGSYSKTAFAWFLFEIIISSIILNISFNFLDSKVEKKTKEQKIDNNFNISKVKLLLITFIPRLMVYIFSFPGSYSNDLVYQTRMGLGYHVLTNKHPWIITIISGKIISFGVKIFGNISNGISFYIFVFMLFSVFILYKLQRYILKSDISKSLKIFSLVFYNIYPIVIWYNSIVWKDIILAMITPIFILLIYEIAKKQEKFFKNKKKVVLIIIVVITYTISKMTAIPGIIFASIYLTFFLKNKKTKIKMLSVVVLPVILFVITNNIIISQFGILPGKEYDKLTIPIQQVARTLKYKYDKLDKDDINTISEIFPINTIRKNYVPTLSDPVKETINYEKYKENPNKYNKIWLKWSFKYPLVYTEAFIANSSLYYIPFSRFESWHYTYLDQKYKFGKGIYDTTEYKYDPNNSKKVEKVNKQLYRISKLPIVGLLLRIGTFTWIYLILFLIILRKKIYDLIPVYLVPFGLFLMCILSPVNGETRYFFGIIFSFPIVLSLTFSKLKFNLRQLFD